MAGPSFPAWDPSGRPRFGKMEIPALSIGRLRFNYFPLFNPDLFGEKHLPGNDRTGPRTLARQTPISPHPSSFFGP